MTQTPRGTGVIPCLSAFLRGRDKDLDKSCTTLTLMADVRGALASWLSREGKDHRILWVFPMKRLKH